MTVILDLFTLFTSVELCGLESIQNLILLVVVFNYEKILPEIKNNTHFSTENLYNCNVESFKKIILLIKNELSLKLGIFNFEINNTIFELYDKIIDIFRKKQTIELDLFFSEVFSFYLNNENLSVSKDYVKLYNNKLLTKWIWELAKPKIGNDGNSILEGNLKVNSIISNINCADQNYFIENLFATQSNNIVSDINTLTLYIKSKTFISKNITSEDVLIKDINLNKKSFDIIFYDFPQGVHNIIHANCCQKIKKFKLRGTKAEPLLLQLIMGSLNKNGKAYLIVPDSLLFSDSIQPVETRKYLLENYCVKKIIQIDEAFYFSKGIKNSILYFENKDKTSNIEFSKISLDCEKIKEDTISTLNINKIKQNIYSLYYKNYQDETSNPNINFKSVDEIFKFVNNKTIKSNSIGLTKYYKNDSSIKYFESDNDTNIDFETIIYIDQTTISNSKSNVFMVKYLENNLRNKWEQFTKGKMNQFDIDKIRSFKLPILSEKTQIAISNYLELTNKMIKCNDEKIQMINQMKECVMKTIPDANLVELSTLSELYNDNIPTSKLIGIIRNGLSAGTIYQIDDISKISNNSHYLVVKNKEYLFDYIYHWLLYNENKLKELSNLTPQSNLNKSNLLSFKIPSIDLEKQQEIISYCNDFELQITRFKQDNKAITDKDILSSVLKLNNV
jgi:hypothetical protein